MKKIPVITPIAIFFQESYQELKKIAWPKRKDVANMTIIVVLTMLIGAILVGALDFGLLAVIKKIIAR
ncbi:preprotein translocase subunit SecE [Candidatus Microgenomates bacterium]|nr:preprotein translocase subunit SecE [Candidatus Microgenomates bacterium]